MSDEIERIRDRVVNDQIVYRDDALALLREVDRLRRMIETSPPWPDDTEPLTDEQMRALKLRWSTGPERYQADADALVATTLRTRAEADRLRARVAELEVEVEVRETDVLVAELLCDDGDCGPCDERRARDAKLREVLP